MSASTPENRPDSSITGQAGAAIKREARDVGREAKAAAEEVARTQRDALADYVAALADAANAAADDLQAAGYGQSAAPVRRTADQVGGFAHRLQQSDVRELWRDAEDVAREHPALVFGAGMALAFGVIRFLRSSPPAAALPEQGPEDPVRGTGTDTLRAAEPEANSSTVAG